MEEKQLTRKERYLTAIVEGDASAMPEKPLTREEVLLEKIVKKPSGSADPTAIQNAVNNYLDEHPVSGADVPATDIDFSNWEEGGNN